MVREFKLPDVGEGIAEGELVTWLAEEGDEASEDQPVAEAETDKALVEVPSPVYGTVWERHYEEGVLVSVGDVFITFDVNDETEPTAAEEEQASEPAGVDSPDEAEADAKTAGDAGAIGGEIGEVAP
jgi:pyruvate dehydrogenase E2 component (dihydrolipoamide acetyltransferase)